MGQLRNNRQAFMLITAMLASSGLLLYMSVGLMRSATELRAATAYGERERTFHTAEAGIDSAVLEVRNRLSAFGQFPPQDPPSSDALNGFSLSEINPPTFSGATLAKPPYQVVYEGAPPPPQPITTGSFAGMTASRRLVRITSESTSTSSGAKIRLVYINQIDLIPVFQFAMFDQGDLFLQPGPPMTINGSIYSNGTINITPVTSLTINGRLTASGEILHNGSNTGSVHIKDLNGNDQSMRNLDGTWVQSTDANWDTVSLDRWGNHTVTSPPPTVTARAPQLKLPLPETVSRPIEIIKLGAASDTQEVMEAKLYYKADLRIVDQVAVDHNGAHPALLPGTVTSAVFYDAREGSDMCVTQIDLGQLGASGAVPANGVLYVGDTAPAGSCKHSVRLVNGSEVPSGSLMPGLTVVTQHPLYVKGDYNTVHKKPAALIADGLTILSDNWDDAKGHAVTSARTASNANVNAAVMAGKIGGASNNSDHVIRFLEDWTGRTFTFTGSEIRAWTSEEASSALACCGNTGAYSPPTRVWSFDASFLSGSTALPPWSPSFYTITSLGWYEEPVH